VQGDNSFLSRLIEASFLTGSLLCDGVGDLVSIETESDPARAARLSYNVLQGAGARYRRRNSSRARAAAGRSSISRRPPSGSGRRPRPEGRQESRSWDASSRAGGNGGRISDTRGAPGKINLYVGKQCVQYNIPQAEADARLIALIKEHKKWAEPEPAHA